MPANLDDPASPTIYRKSGPAPFPDPNMPPSLPDDILPRQVTLRDRQTTATIVPFASRDQLPASLLSYLCHQFNKEIEGGDTYPVMDLFTDDGFANYWFQNFGAVMLLGDIDGPGSVVEGKDWSRECLGSFYIKPNYPGRSSHICNAGFIVTDASRGRGVGRSMGEAYIDWAPRLGYTYSVFNLVYETNVASCRLWDALGFKRIGRVKGCGNLKSYPDRLIDAIIYGRDMVPGETEELVSEERFDKIKYYLKYGKYPNGADRAEKSRLRSAATHYKLVGDDKLMLKDKEVISDPAKQYDIAREVHMQLHGGINKTTATIAEKYHWSRIKETVSDVIRNCTECKDIGKAPYVGAARKSGIGTSNALNAGVTTHATSSPAGAATAHSATYPGSMNGDSTSREATSPSLRNDTKERVLELQDHQYSLVSALSPGSTSSPGFANPNDLSSVLPSQTLQNTVGTSADIHRQHAAHHHDDSAHHHQQHAFHQSDGLRHGIFQDQQHHPHNQDHHHHHNQYQPIDPQIINQSSFDHYHTQDFQALLNATGDDDETMVPHQESDSVDRDLEMLIDHQDDDIPSAMHDHVHGAGIGNATTGKTSSGEERPTTIAPIMVGNGGDGEDRHRIVYDMEFTSGDV